MIWIYIIQLVIMTVSAGLIIPQIFLLVKQLQNNTQQLENQHKQLINNNQQLEKQQQLLESQKEQIQKHHEERRRENTVTFMSNWYSSVKKDTFIAEQVARQLNPSQCQSLYQHNSFYVSEEIKKDICKFCPLVDKCDNCSLKGSNKIDGKILTELRWHVIAYLNTLETMLVAWDLGIVDKKTVEEQFQFLCDSSRGETLVGFRHSAGGYPVIEKFLDAIKEKGSKPRKQL